jgi:hypothetical protein
MPSNGFYKSHKHYNYKSFIQTMSVTKLVLLLILALSLKQNHDWSVSVTATATGDEIIGALKAATGGQLDLSQALKQLPGAHHA